MERRADRSKQCFLPGEDISKGYSRKQMQNTNGITERRSLTERSGTTKVAMSSPPSLMSFVPFVSFGDVAGVGRRSDILNRVVFSEKKKGEGERKLWNGPMSFWG